MAKFRKKPVVIEAWQWNFDEPEQEPIPGWLNVASACWPTAGVNFETGHPDGPRIAIATLEGVMVAKPKDWIIKGIKGELYPCKPDIFEATYEPVD